MLVHSWHLGSDSRLLQRFCPTAAVLNEPFINFLSLLAQACWKLCHLNCALCALLLVLQMVWLHSFGSFAELVQVCPSCQTPVTIFSSIGQFGLEGLRCTVCWHVGGLLKLVNPLVKCWLSEWAWKQWETSFWMMSPLTVFSWNADTQRKTAAHF